MSCRYCGRDRKLVRAHIIPEGFYRRIRNDDPDLYLVSEVPGEYPKRAWIGPYDEGILCERCDGRFGKWDDYAQKLLGREAPGAAIVSRSGEIVGYEPQDYQYSLLKLFFISLLWRASVSSHVLFQSIQLGPYERRAKELLDSEEPGEADEFAVLLAKFAPHPAAEGMFSPYQKRIGDINYIHFYFGGYVARIKVDQRPVPKEFEPLVLAAGRPLSLVGLSFVGSPEYFRMRDVVMARQNRRALKTE
jgi:hypothetical protein